MTSNFKQWLEQELLERKMSPAELSRLARKDQGVISRILNGERKPNPETLEAIAHALKIPSEQVFRAAGLLPPKPDEDPWVEEQAHKLKLIPASRRGIAGRFIETMIDEEEEPEKKPRKKAPSPSGRGAG